MPSLAAIIAYQKSLMEKLEAKQQLAKVQPNSPAKKPPTSLIIGTTGALLLGGSILIGYLWLRKGIKK